MAVYFDFKKKRPHINCDDVYIKNGEVKDDWLVLGYSIPELNQLSISLSSFNTTTALSNMQFHATDEKSILSIALAIEQIVTAFGGNKNLIQ